MTKQEQIEVKKSKLIEVNDFVLVSIPYVSVEETTEGRGKKKTIKTVKKKEIFKIEGYVKEIINHPEHGLSYKITIGSHRIPSEINLYSEYDENYGKMIIVKSEFVEPTFYECGFNPFKKESYRINFYNQPVSSILLKMCYCKRTEDNFEKPEYDTYSSNNSERNKQFIGKTYGGVNFDPYVINKDGEKQHYQRGLVWTTKQKQLLIDSMYNNIEIGKFLFRYNSWGRLERGMVEDGHGYSWDCVDGKQRLNAILEFIQNKFPDSYGNYFRDLSTKAQNRVLEYDKLSVGQLDERATDSDVVTTFLTLNYTGTPMSEDHIEYVKSIKI